jgi:3-hydroxyisobutyrate dehydrogenase-like beta-hydroxyacid dehydrogenase
MDRVTEMVDARKNIAVLYPGEMGAALAALLASRGLRVITTLGNRGEQTARRCRAMGIAVLDTFKEVVESADVVISLVPPAAAEEVAREYCELAHLAPARAIFVDANSIGPELAGAIAARFERHGVDFVDGAINGLAKNLATTCTFFLSGQRAADVAGLIGGDVKVRLLGDHPGRASAMKMLLSGLSKGVCGLFVETALIAHRHGMLAEMIDSYSKIYPGVMGIVERMMPTYPLHAERRATEMREVEQTAHAAGLEPCMLAAARHVHELLAGADFGAGNELAQSDCAQNLARTVPAVIERLAAENILSADVPAESAAPGASAGAPNVVREKCHGQ